MNEADQDLKKLIKKTFLSESFSIIMDFSDKRFQRALDYASRCILPDAEEKGISSTDITTTLNTLNFYNCEKIYNTLPESLKPEFNDVFNTLQKKSNYGNTLFYLTFQEQVLLMGKIPSYIILPPPTGSENSLQRKFRKEFEECLIERCKMESYPYMPVCVVDESYTVETMRETRSFYRKTSALGKFFNLEKEVVSISLEPLDDDGNTIRDPQVLDINMYPIETKYSSDFLFRRNP